MLLPTRTSLVALAFALGCSSSQPEPTKGRLIVLVTVDWEGAYFSADGLAGLARVRATLNNAPFTHFVSSAYFTKREPDPAAAQKLKSAIHSEDEVGIHLHVWKSLALASGIQPKLSPSFLTGTDKIIEFEDGDLGFDTDLDVYEVHELRSLLRTSRQLLERTGLSISPSFRAGGQLGTPKMLQAIADEGFAIDSSAIDPRVLDADKDHVFAERIREIWPTIRADTQPFVIETSHRTLVEFPVATIVDTADANELARLFEAAHGRLRQRPDRDQFVVIAINQETAAIAPETLGVAFDKLRDRLAADIFFATASQVADLVQKHTL